MIVDAHAHIFRAFGGMTEGQPTVSLKWGKVKVGNTVRQMLPPSFESSNAPVEVLLGYMDWCGVDKALLVPNIFYGYDNEYAAEAVAKWPDRFAALGLVDITKGKQAADELQGLIESGSFKGLKIEVPSALQCVPGLRIDDELFAPVWEKCDELGLPVMIHIRPGAEELESLKTVYRRYANITFIISHLGNPPYEGWREFLKFAAQPRIWVEISALPWQFAPFEEYPYPTAQEHIRIAREELGADRLIWGSDFPMLLSVCTYQQTLDLVKRNCPFFTEDERRLVLGDTVARLLKL